MCEFIFVLIVSVFLKRSAPAAEPLPVEEYTTSGEGTASDGKGSTKKVFFIQKKKDEDAAAAPPRCAHHRASREKTHPAGR